MTEWDLAYMRREVPPASAAQEDDPLTNAELRAGVALQLLEIERLRAQVAALEVLLDDAIEEIEGWGEYAPAYFKQKHDLEGTLARFRAARKGGA